jgi:hypothetical protein
MSKRAIAHLSSDPVMSALIERIGPIQTRPRRLSPFQSLAHAIIHQQLNSTAAGTILERFKGLFPDGEFPAAGQVAKATVDRLRMAGLSRPNLLTQFRTDCQTRLDNNTNKIAKLATASRTSLTKNNDDFRDKIAKNAQINAGSLENMRQDMQAVSVNPKLDPRIIRDQLTTYIAGMESWQKSTMDIFSDFDKAISNAPPQRGLLDFIKITTH